MPFKIVRNDITKVKADVIVNTANLDPMCASGTDRAIAEALFAVRPDAGESEIKEAAAVNMQD